MREKLSLPRRTSSKLEDADLQALIRMLKLRLQSGWT
jgi:hypothetical protein